MTITDDTAAKLREALEDDAIRCYPDFTGAVRGLIARSTALEAERDAEKARADAADAERDEARAALEPFSQFAGVVFERNFNNDDPVDTMTAADGGQAMLYARDFFRARAVLARTGEPKDE